MLRTLLFPLAFAAGPLWLGPALAAAEPAQEPALRPGQAFFDWGKGSAKIDRQRSALRSASVELRPGSRFVLKVEGDGAFLLEGGYVATSASSADLRFDRAFGSIKASGKGHVVLQNGAVRSLRGDGTFAGDASFALRFQGGGKAPEPEKPQTASPRSSDRRTDGAGAPPRASSPDQPSAPAAAPSEIVDSSPLEREFRAGKTGSREGSGTLILGRQRSTLTGMDAAFSRLGTAKFTFRGDSSDVFEGWWTRGDPGLLEVDILARGKDQNTRGKGKVGLLKDGEISWIHLEGKLGDGRRFRLDFNARNKG